MIYLPALDECGPLSDDPHPNRGLAAVRVNYPYQAAALSAFQTAPPIDGDPLPPNWSRIITADDGAVQQNNAPPGELAGDPGGIGPYAGPFGLGRQLAFAGRTVRPFRRLVSAQAVFRREVFQ